MGRPVAVAGKTLERGAARVAETEQTRPLVERLPGGIVDRLPQDCRCREVPDEIQPCVPPGGDQADERRIQGDRLQPRRADVPEQVVDADQGQSPDARDRLGRRHTDQQRTDQSGALGDRDRGEVVEPQPGDRERLVDDAVHGAEVVPRGNLRHDAPVRRVQGRLRGDDRREDPASVDDCGRGFVARGLDRQEGSVDHAPTPSCSGSPPRHMIRASSLLSL